MGNDYSAPASHPVAARDPDGVPRPSVPYRGTGGEATPLAVGYGGTAALAVHGDGVLPYRTGDGPMVADVGGGPSGSAWGLPPGYAAPPAEHGGYNVTWGGGYGSPYEAYPAVRYGGYGSDYARDMEQPGYARTYRHGRKVAPALRAGMYEPYDADASGGYGSLQAAYGQTAQAADRAYAYNDLTDRYVAMPGDLYGDPTLSLSRLTAYDAAPIPLYPVSDRSTHLETQDLRGDPPTKVPGGVGASVPRAFAGTVEWTELRRSDAVHPELGPPPYGPQVH